MNYKFTNDYSFGASKEILDAINKYNFEQNIGYGLDKHSINAKDLILKRFNSLNGDCFFLTGGTQANMTLISFILKPYEAVLSCDTGHINVHETGAVEATGHKIYTVKNKDGKITKDDILNALSHNTNEHSVKLKLVYISDSTESGSIYTKKELTEIKKVCEDNDLYLFLDGARLASALTSTDNDIKPEDLSKLTDFFYVGGTKNGMLYGEAIVFNNKELSKEFRYHIKNKGAMLAKGFSVAIQFERAFIDNHYFDLGKHSNDMAKYIYDNLKDDVEFVYSKSTNQLFINVDKVLKEELIDYFGLEVWEELDNQSVLRIVTCFNTTINDCDELIKYIKRKK